MMNFSSDKTTVARFVLDLIVNSGIDSASITITVRGSSEVCSVSIVTDTSLEDIVKRKAQNYFSQPTNTLPGNTQAG